MSAAIKEEIKDKLIGSPGFASHLHLEADELEVLRKIVNEHFNKRLQETTNVSASLPAANYHSLNIKDHTSIWKKDARFINEESIRIIKGFKVFDDIRKELGDFQITKRIDQSGKVFNTEEIYWRLVRPYEKTDVGPIHADIWFADALDYYDQLIEDKDSLKLWIPIYVEPGKSGLSMVPESHKKSWNYKFVSVNGSQRPKIIDMTSPTLIETVPGQILMFGENMLHAGALNKGQDTRVSVEITLLFEKHTLYKR